MPVPYTSNPGYGPDGGAGQGARAGNYAVFDSLSADSILIRTEEDRISGSTRRSPITAVQIIPRASPLPPAIAPLQASQVYAGRTARFRALAAGLLPMTYQWQKNGVNLADGGNISGATTPTLTITSVSAGDAATYSLVASNANGMATNSAALTLWAPVPGSYAEKIITNNPVAYWRFNETGDPSTNNTPAYDYVGGFNGTYAQAAMNGFNGVQGPQPSDWPGFESHIGVKAS